MKSKVVLVLCLLLLCSLGTNVFFARKTMHYYTLLNALRLDPLELNFYSKPESISSKKRVVMIGDSRVLAWPSIQSTSFETYNRGIHGQTSIQIRERFETHVSALQPDIVILQLGMNDLKTIGLFPQRKDEIMNDCQKNIGILVEKSRELHAKVILMTVIPAGPIPLIRQPVWSDDINDAVRDVNNHIKNIDLDSVYIFDAAALIDRTQYIDALHLQKQAYERLNQHLEKFILRAIRQSED